MDFLNWFEPEHAGLAISFKRRAPLFKGCTVVVLALISTAQVDQYITHGRYTDAAMAMLRQIGRAFGF
jgi:hypothetical protein